MRTCITSGSGGSVRSAPAGPRPRARALYGGPEEPYHVSSYRSLLVWVLGVPFALAGATFVGTWLLGMPLWAVILLAVLLPVLLTPLLQIVHGLRVARSRVRDRSDSWANAPRLRNHDDAREAARVPRSNVLPLEAPAQADAPADRIQMTSSTDIAEDGSETREAVHVVVVNYRSAPLTLELLASLVPEKEELAKIGATLRAVVVENDSGEFEQLEQGIADGGFGDWATLIRAPGNGGYADGNNIGTAHGYGLEPRPSYFHYLNPDARIRPRAVCELVNFLREHPRVGLAGSSFYGGDEKLWPFAFRFPTLFSEIESSISFGPISKLFGRWVVARVMGDVPEKTDWGPGASMMVRREVIDQIGGMDANFFLYFEETDFCRSAQQQGWEYWRVPASRVLHYAGHSTGVTKQRDHAVRLPGYWYESRRRYYVKNHGRLYAVLCDLAACFSTLLGNAKYLAQGRRRLIVPHRIRDILRYSPLWPRQRRRPQRAELPPGPGRHRICGALSPAPGLRPTVPHGNGGVRETGSRGATPMSSGHLPFLHVLHMEYL